MVVEVIFPDCVLLALLYGLVHGRVRQWLHHWLRDTTLTSTALAAARAGIAGTRPEAAVCGSVNGV